ncbi:hypothetical protein ANCDUO_24227 [Ancylostoma duodenale]|uniref:Nematode fatty acid retinoid binding protein n=1 Tax=Ancylostoma duodenale TaxID=51022 RepID=A0A0C2FG98_9BILA|nr:hypothetical protein ANCDUO_24227 [Ancylostoma duodenale]
MSPQLADKFEQFRAHMNAKAAALGPEARAFFDEVRVMRGKEQLRRRRAQARAQMYAGVRPSFDQMRQSRLEVMNMYRAMSPAGQADFQRQFPMLAMHFSSKHYFCVVTTGYFIK